jgi:hypothetical protein
MFFACAPRRNRARPGSPRRVHPNIVTSEPVLTRQQIATAVDFGAMRDLVAASGGMDAQCRPRSEATERLRPRLQAQRASRRRRERPRSGASGPSHRDHKIFANIYIVYILRSMLMRPVSTRWCQHAARWNRTSYELRRGRRKQRGSSAAYAITHIRYCIVQHGHQERAPIRDGETHWWRRRHRQPSLK